MDEDYSPGREINEPVRERSNRHGSESSTLEIDVYVWRYALRVVHARNERTNEGLSVCFIQSRSPEKVIVAYQMVGIVPAL